MTDLGKVTESVKEYYGETLQSTDDLKTSACCPIDAMPEYLLTYLNKIHDEVKSKFYGCGSPIPHAIEGKTILDLGCGTGRDVYTLSQLVGESGYVIGVDMTDNQLAVAKKHINYHMNKFNHEAVNVDFRQGYIEDLKTAGLKDNSVDIVVSNCVVNLSGNKQGVFSEIFRVLKPGGELYFSDVFTGRRVPEELSADPILLGECLGGAIYIEDFRRLLRDIGCLDYRVVSKSPIVLNDADIQQKAGMIDFYSMTIRTFKCDFEDICENYGHVAYYRGTISHCPHAFVLDNHHLFPNGQPVAICGNTARMLTESHYAKHFRVEGNFSTHYGAFDCSSPSTAGQTDTEGCC